MVRPWSARGPTVGRWDLMENSAAAWHGRAAAARSECDLRPRARARAVGTRIGFAAVRGEHRSNAAGFRAPTVVPCGFQGRGGRSSWSDINQGSARRAWDRGFANRPIPTPHPASTTLRAGSDWASRPPQRECAERSPGCYRPFRVGNLRCGRGRPLMPRGRRWRPGVPTVAFRWRNPSATRVRQDAAVRFTHDPDIARTPAPPHRARDRPPCMTTMTESSSSGPGRWWGPTGSNGSSAKAATAPSGAPSGSNPGSRSSPSSS